MRYFANAFDTTTQGIDIVARYPMVHDSGSTTLTLAANVSDTSIDRIKSTGVDEKRKRQMEDNLPGMHYTLSAFHVLGPWQFLTRLRYDHDFHEYQADFVGYPIEAGARLLVDAEVGHAFDNGIRITVGARNLLDTHPTGNPWARDSGTRYPDSSPYGFSGGGGLPPECELRLPGGRRDGERTSGKRRNGPSGGVRESEGCPGGSSVMRTAPRSHDGMRACGDARRSVMP